MTAITRLQEACSFLSKEPFTGKEPTETQWQAVKAFSQALSQVTHPKLQATWNNICIVLVAPPNLDGKFTERCKRVQSLVAKLTEAPNTPPKRHIVEDLFELFASKQARVAFNLSRPMRPVSIKDEKLFLSRLLRGVYGAGTKEKILSWSLDKLKAKLARLVMVDQHLRGENALQRILPMMENPIDEIKLLLETKCGLSHEEARAAILSASFKGQTTFALSDDKWQKLSRYFDTTPELLATIAVIQAKEMPHKAMELAQKVVGPKRNQTIADCLSLIAQDQLDLAISFFEKLQGEEKPLVQKCAHALAKTMLSGINSVEEVWPYINQIEDEEDLLALAKEFCPKATCEQMKAFLQKVKSVEEQSHICELFIASHSFQDAASLIESLSDPIVKQFAKSSLLLTHFEKASTEQLKKVYQEIEAPEIRADFLDRITLAKTRKSPLVVIEFLQTPEEKMHFFQNIAMHCPELANEAAKIVEKEVQDPAMRRSIFLLLDVARTDKGTLYT